MNSEFRQDLVSGDWVVISPKRFNRPSQFKKKIKRKIVSKRNCPFENPQKDGNRKAILAYPDFNNWLIQILPNKYPILKHGNFCPIKRFVGPYAVIDGDGLHDLAITRDHYKNFAHLDKKTAIELFKIFQKRHLMLKNDKCLQYVFIFHNWGPKAGASVYHPHYQIISLPIIPPDVSRSLDGSSRYFRKNKKCVHCAMIEYELKNKKRIVYENKEAVAFTPFAAKEPFELRIFPKKHASYFEKTAEGVISGIVDALQKSLLLFEKKLGDPDYNFFIHTAPIGGGGKPDYYHWHIEIQPKLTTLGGVEIGTGVEITTIDPDAAAKILKR